VGPPEKGKEGGERREGRGGRGDEERGRSPGMPKSRVGEPIDYTGYS